MNTETEEYIWLCQLARAVASVANPLYPRVGQSPIEHLLDVWAQKPETVTWVK